MSNFFKLVYNEQMKMYIRKSTWVMYIILAVIIIAGGLITKAFDDQDQPYDQDNWRTALETENEELIKENEEYQEKLEENEDAFIIGPNMNKVEENNFFLENDIQPDGYGALHYVYDNLMLLSIVSLFTIIIAAGIVASEFRWGTIKLLLIRPISRTIILLSKYVSVVLFSVVTSLFVFLFSWITGAILFGIEGANPHMILYADMFAANGDFEYVSIAYEVFSGYGYQLINLIMMATFALMISTIFRNSSLAIGVSIFLMFAGNQIVLFFAERSWAKYILFANTDLKQYESGHSPILEGMTLPFSITVLIVYYLIFIALSWLFFVRRDVAGQ